MPDCTVCKIETDYEYDIALSNGEYLHYSCIITLQMQKHEIETALQKQKSQRILSLFVPNAGVEQDAPFGTEIEDLHAKLAKLKSVLTEIYDHLPCWPPDWDERKRRVIRENGSICSQCGKEQDVYLLHDIPVFEGGTNELDTLRLICRACYTSMYREPDIFGTRTLKPSQTEFAGRFSEIQSAIDNHQKIRCDYKKPSAKIRNLAVLGIANTILQEQGVFITDGIAADGDTRFYSLSAGLGVLQVNLKILQSPLWVSWTRDPELRRKLMAECLVPNQVNPEYISQFIVPDQSIANSLQTRLSPINMQKLVVATNRGSNIFTPFA